MAGVQVVAASWGGADPVPVAFVRPNDGGGTGRGGLAGALPPTIGPVQGPEADRRGRSVPDRRQSEPPQSAEDTPARDGQSAIAGAAAQPAVRCSYRIVANASRQKSAGRLMWYSVAKCLGRQRSEAIAAGAALLLACAFAAQAQEKISDGVVKIGMLEDMSSMPGRLSHAGAPLSEVIGPPLNYT